MILNDAVVKVIRDALSDYESATGLECQIRYADRLSAKVEMALELAENVPESVAKMPVVRITEFAEESRTEPTELNLHQQIIQMDKDGKSLVEIAMELGISVQTVHHHLKFKREQEAK